MLISFLHFMAQLIIALVILRLTAMKLLQHNPDSDLAKAITFVS